MSQLVQLGASVDAVNSQGETPLHRAARWGHTACIQALLDARSDFTAVDSNGKTAMQWAQQKGFQDGCAMLTSAGAGSAPPATQSPADSDSGAALGQGDTTATDAGATAAVGSAQHAFGKPMRVEGWLQKAGGPFGRRKNRWFVLDGRTLTYYASEKCTAKDRKGIVRMREGSSVFVADSYDRPNCFNVAVPERTYTLQATDTEEMVEWIEAIQNNLDVCPAQFALEEWDAGI